MEVIDTVALIVFVTIGIFVPAGVAYRFYQQKKMSWRILANNNGLTYTRSNWFKGGDFIDGNFQGFQLKLETTGTRVGDEEGQTHIVLSAAPSRLLTPRVQQLPEDTATIASKLKVFNDARDLRGEIKGGQDPVVVSYKQDGIEADVKYLQSVLDLLGDTARAYSLALSLEGRAVPYLREAALNRESQLRAVIIQLLADILQITSARLDLKKVRFLCRTCLTNYDIQRIELSRRESCNYYGCRVCRKSQDYFEVNKVVALLDAGFRKDKFLKNDLLLVNWTVRRKLFDFDEIIIAEASDEEVERFAVQMGNDTDPLRRAVYPEIRCTISPACKLSENTLRILRRMVGEIEIKDLSQVGRPTQ